MFVCLFQSASGSMDILLGIGIDSDVRLAYFIVMENVNDQISPNIDGIMKNEYNVTDR